MQIICTECERAEFKAKKPRVVINVIEKKNWVVHWKKSYKLVLI